MSDRIFNRLRRGVVIAAATFGAAATWGSLAAVAAKLTFELAERNAWLFVGLPVAVAMAAFIGPKASRILGFDE